MVFANAAISALIAVSESGAHVEMPDWVVGLFLISIGISSIMLFLHFCGLLK